MVGPYKLKYKSNIENTTFVRFVSYMCVTMSDTFFYSKVMIRNHMVCDIMFDVTFNNISVISLRSVLLIEETEVSGENEWPAASH